MQPNDITFVLLLLVLTLAVTAFAVFSWKWKRWQLGRRLAVVFLAQIMVLLTLGGYLNADQGFYTSWSDLFGIQSTQNQAREVFNRPVGNAPNGKPVNPIKKGVAGLGTGIVTSLVDRADAGKSRIVEVVLHGKRTGYSFAALVYLPGSYSARTEKKRKFPVVELLSGYPGSPYAWPLSMKLKDYLDDEIRHGRAPAMVAVMPRQDPAPPRDSECVNAVGGAQAATYLGEDVPDAVASQFRVRTDRGGWGLMGVSTGGFCAANLALNYPHRFYAAASLSGYYTAITDDTTGDLYRGNAQVRMLNSPQWTIGHRKHPPLAFFVFAAMDSVEDQSWAVNFAKAVQPPDGITLELSPSGGHTRIGWMDVQPKAWDWFGRVLG
jgi:enterochelin esterase-like enzyme